MKIDKYADWDNLITNNRFVAFLDIMGFKDMVARKTHDEVYKTLHSIYAMIEYVPLGGVRDLLYITMFSDSIVVFSKDDTVNSFIKIISMANIFISNCMQKKIPLKGGLAHGEISVDTKKNIFFGQALIDAYQMEEDVCYYGLVCHNTIDRWIDNYYLTSKSIFQSGFYTHSLFIDRSILKSGQITHYNGSWFSLTESFPERKKIVIRMLSSMYSEVSGSPRRYIDNTLEMYERYKKNIALSKIHDNE